MKRRTDAAQGNHSLEEVQKCAGGLVDERLYKSCEIPCSQKENRIEKSNCQKDCYMDRLYYVPSSKFDEVKACLEPPRAKKAE